MLNMWRITMLLSSYLIFAQSANILGIAPVPVRSHNTIFKSILVALAQRGHNVTFLSDFPPTTQNIANFTEMYLPFDIKNVWGALQIDFLSIRDVSPLEQIYITSNVGIVNCEFHLKLKEMQQFLDSDSNFDLIITDGFLAESISGGIFLKYKAPMIAILPFQSSYLNNYLVSNEAPSSYIPEPYTGYTPPMTFFQRLNNLMIQTIGILYFHNVYLPKQQNLLKTYFGHGAPPLLDILKNTSLLLVNDHYSLSFPRPTVPNIIPIGGIHVMEPKQLPQEVHNFLDEAEKGAIFFSFGSLLKGSAMPREKIDIFLNVFSQIEEKVLWKFEEDLDGISNNLLISKWLPQSDILAHPNLKLFITHGGILSSIESTERGVPILGIPIFGDQYTNVRNAVNAGVGLAISYDDLSEETLLGAIRELLDNSKYREAAVARSKLLKDQPMKPLDTAVWWTEYVLRHKGAKHLRSVGHNMSWGEKNQLHVMSFLLAIVLILIAILLTAVKIILMKIHFKIVQAARKKKRN